ncbi:MAG: parallel beta-helix domain-containing protein [bacterium]
MKSKFKKVFWGFGVLVAVLLGFIYLPLPGLEGSHTKSIGWQQGRMPPSQINSRAEEHFRLLEASTNLQRPFPEMPVRPENPTTPEKVELGRLLYFDPMLSADNDISCGHCHHPDLGFSDNRGLSMGRKGTGVGPARRNGAVLRRGSPTIWNAAYNHRQFWDGRARDLEDQARNPIQDQNEMAQDSTELVKELQATPAYVRLFEKAFGASNGSTITFEKTTYAIAAFERTVLSHNSAFDRYAAGEVTALTLSERRGLNVFRSLKTRCFECHNLPAFANPDFKVIGVPDLPGGAPDLGRAEIAGAGYERAFKVPTLRNVALTAPYMHNGIFKTLDEVIDFYAGGGGPGRGLVVPNLDDKIRQFTLLPEEKQDLIAFLHALTDESAKPEIPAAVPSGLPVVTRLENQSIEMQTFQAPTISDRPVRVRREGKRLLVQPGESIQAAVDAAQAGDTVAVLPGIYHEALTVEVSGLTLWGIEQNGEQPVLDGRNILSDGLIGSASHFEMRNFTVRNYSANGLMLNGAKHVTFREVDCENPGLYGLYPVECLNVLIERCSVTGAKDAGIYVGQSRDIVVRDCKAYANVCGIEIENSMNATVENNEAFDNAGGILVFLLPNNPSKISQNCRVLNNRVYANNHANFGDPNAIVSRVPSGTGILILAADEVEVAHNEIRDNQSLGVAVLGLDLLFSAGTRYDVDPIPERCWIHSNTMNNNGNQPAGIIKEMGYAGADLLWDLSGYDNSWHQPGASKMPALLPNNSWPELVRRANWRLWKVLMKLVG